MGAGPRPDSLMKRYLFNVLIGLDQFGNTLTGGDPDETISSRCAKNQDKWYWRALGAALEAVDPGHLRRALEPDEGKDAAF